MRLGYVAAGMTGAILAASVAVIALAPIVRHVEAAPDPPEPWATYVGRGSGCRLYRVTDRGRDVYFTTDIHETCSQPVVVEREGGGAQ